MNTNVSKRLRRLGRKLARGVTLVEVLIVVAIMALIAGGATVLVIPEYRKAQVKSAVIGASQVKTAAETYKELESTSEGCPTIQDLVNAKKIDGKKTDDPWGTPYKIKCEEGDIHVVSSGRDRKDATPDDVRDDFKASDIEKVGKL